MVSVAVCMYMHARLKYPMLDDCSMMHMVVGAMIVASRCHLAEREGLGWGVFRTRQVLQGCRWVDEAVSEVTCHFDSLCYVIQCLVCVTL